MADRRIDREAHGAPRTSGAQHRFFSLRGWPPARRKHQSAPPTPKPPPEAPSPRVQREGPKTQAASYPDWRGPVARFGAGLVASVAALILLGYFVGHGPDVGLGTFVESVLEAATGKVTGAVLALLLLACIAWCIRRLWLEWLAARPGQVVVPVFETVSDLPGANPVHLTAQFRQRLATLRLQSPAPVPGSAPEGDFVEVLGQRSLDGGNPLGAVFSLLQAAKPPHAYVVHGVLVERAESPRHGVTVQVVRWPEQGSPPETVYDVDWERAVRRAADRAMAYILPRTRICKTPWASWRGFVMPPDLLETYEAAARFEQERRYDQALACYFEAVERDPINLSLRLCIGNLQEKLGLFVDALATYEGMIAVAEATRGTSETPIYSKTAQRERDRAELLGRYRRLVLLGGPPLGRQWRHTSAKGQWTERDAQRAELRDRLRGALMKRLRKRAKDLKALRGKPVPSLRELLEEPDRRLPPDEEDALRNQLRRLFVLHARDQIEDVQDKLRTLEVGRGEAPVALTDTSLALTRLCLEERCKWIEQRLAAPESDPWIWDHEDLKQLGERVRKACGDSGMLRWHEHYNAACAFALPLLVEDTEEKSKDKERFRLRDLLATRAVEHLEKATSCADSGYIATRRDWLLSEDPDLDGLRAHSKFKAFEAMYFPAPAPVPRRPRDIQPLEVATYTRDLLDATARRWQAEWHIRRNSADLEDPRVLLQWWQDEARAWQLVGRTAWNHRRWRVRYELLEAMDELSMRYGGAPLDVAFRPFEAPWMCIASEREADKHAKKALGAATEQNRQLAKALSNGRPTAGKFGIGGISDWIERLRDKKSDGQWAYAEDVTGLCDRHAAVWEGLDLWLTDGATSDRFRTQMAKLTEQLRSAA